MPTPGVLKTYYALTKPGIIYGNIMTAAAGFVLASKAHGFSLTAFMATMLGVGLVIASACVVNNYIDRTIDRRMARTQKRALVTGAVSGRNALMYATVLGLIGFGCLIWQTNSLTVLLGIVAYGVYVALYGFSKRQAPYGTLVGSIAGALPPAAGYTAASGQFDSAAWTLFLLLVLWQMPHFYAIAIYRLKDYSAAVLPVLPVKRGEKATKVRIVLYIAVFAAATPLLTLFGYTGYTYAAVMGLCSLGWLAASLRGFGHDDHAAWARKVFFYSLTVLIVLSVMVATGAFLP